MKIKTCKITQKLLDDYSMIPISFKVDSIYTLTPMSSGLDGIQIKEDLIESYIKDYDTLEDNPSHLLNKFDTSHWRILVAIEGDKILGGGIIAYDTKGVNMLEDRKDLAVLWDLRVEPEFRRQKIGERIIDEVKKWAEDNHCRRIKIETQNINVKACRFYAKQGAELTGYNRYCYKDHPEEIQFIWSIYID